MNSKKLTKLQFHLLLDCIPENCISQEIKNYFNTLDPDEQLNFDHESYQDEKIEAIADKYDHIILTNENKFWGVNGDDFEFIFECKGAWEEALESNF
jgi:hypothetical protein